MSVAGHVNADGTMADAATQDPLDVDAVEMHNVEDGTYPGDLDDGKDDGRRSKRKRPMSEPSDGKGEAKVGRYVVNDVAYNTRGYQVCGFVNQRDTLCGRIGNCPFHKDMKSKVEDDRRMSEPAKDGKHIADYQGVLRLQEPPSKKRFKQSWTPEEHQRFLEAMRQFSKGNWKRIAEAVGTRTANQCQSHAQKYFLRQKTPREQRKKKSIHDATDMDPNNPDDPSGIHRLSALATGANGQNPGVGAPIVVPIGGLGPSQVQALQLQMQANPQLMTMDQAALSAAMTNAAMGQKMRVTVHRNGEAHGGKAMIVPQTLDHFFRLAAEKLEGKNYCRAFTRSGGEISNLDELCHDDSLWLSDGQDFIFPPPA
ncbi:hypothetical protein NDN08_004734 [Rhodosorus marinus]|uniref:Uncharacterized protein n=1 Tax=Rhodosorus marinus TaxID=101924 RepID=A0AAV8UQP6_9RHOD|nr:hypothetical protein NDN08_004734 [Rhodosorus marinus]